jgi:gas vesicle protein
MKKGKFLFGALLGTGLGMLFAPRKGSETRRELGVKLNAFVKDLQEIDLEEVKTNVEAKIAEIQKSLKELDKETVFKVAKEKTEELKVAAGDLFEMVKDVANPVLEDAAKAIKASLTDVTKEVLKKLEGDETEK